MPTYSKLPLSGSTNGRPILVDTTGSGSAITLHQGISGTQDWDEVWLYAHNTSLDYSALHCFWGGTSQPDDRVDVDIPPQTGLVLVAPGMLIQNSLYIKAYADDADVINIMGFVNRILNSGS